MIRYLSLFSGIGAFEKALDNLGIPYELLAYCEVDKYASKAYSFLHHSLASQPVWLMDSRTESVGTTLRHRVT